MDGGIRRERERRGRPRGPAQAMLADRVPFHLARESVRRVSRGESDRAYRRCACASITIATDPNTTSAIHAATYGGSAPLWPSAWPARMIP